MLKQIFKRWFHRYIYLISLALLIGVVTLFGLQYKREQEKNILQTKIEKLSQEAQMLQALSEQQSASQSALVTELETLKNEDPRKTNQELKNTISQIEKTFTQTSTAIIALSDSRNQGINVTTLEKDLAQALNLLAKTDYAEAGTKLASIIQKANDQIAAKQTQITAAPAQDLPSAGSYRRQSVSTDRGTFTVSLIAEQASSVRVVTDTGDDDNELPNRQRTENFILDIDKLGNDVLRGHPVRNYTCKG